MTPQRTAVRVNRG